MRTFVIARYMDEYYDEQFGIPDDMKPGLHTEVTQAANLKELAKKFGCEPEEWEDELAASWSRQANSGLHTVRM